MKKFVAVILAGVMLFLFQNFKPNNNGAQAINEDSSNNIGAQTSAFNYIKVTQLFVDPINGQDPDPTRNFTSNLGSQENPFRTIDAAKLRVRQLIPSSSGHIVVFLREGIHYISRPLVFDQRDSGNPNLQISYVAYPNEKPIISAGKNINADSSSSWEAYKNGIYKKRLTDFEPFRQLYVSDSMATRARYPNLRDYNSMGPYLTTVSASSSFDNSETEKYFTLKTQDIPREFPLNSNAEMVVHPHWYHYNLRIKKIVQSTDTSNIYLKDIESEKAFNKDPGFYAKNSYFLENDLSLLDAPGEWYLDNEQMDLYYIPKDEEDISSLSMFAPQAENIIVIKGNADKPVSNIQFRWLKLMHSNMSWPNQAGILSNQGFQILNPQLDKKWLSTSAIEISFAKDIVFSKNQFNLLAGTAIHVKGDTNNIQIINNTFSEIGGNGVYLMGNEIPGKSEITNTLIGNNYFQHIGRVVSNADPIVSIWANNTTIEYNNIINCPYSGIQIGSQHSDGIYSSAHHNTIRHNKIQKVMQVHDDGGGIYTLGRQFGTIIYSNYLSEIQRGPYAMDYPVSAIYLDNLSELITSIDNLITNSIRPLFQQTKEGFQAKNNIVKDRTLRVEAESKAVTRSNNFVIVEDKSLYSDGKGIQIQSDPGSIAKASFRFTGKDGFYEIKTSYISDSAENPYSIFINGIDKSNLITSAKNAGQTKTSAQKMSFTINQIRLKYYDLILIKSQQSKSRLDYFDITESNSEDPSLQEGRIANYIPPIKIEAESLNNQISSNTQNFTLEKIPLLSHTITNGIQKNYNIPAFSGAWGLAAEVAKTGKANFKFTGANGFYNIRLAYLTENDGRALHSISQNNIQIASWKTGLSRPDSVLDYDQFVVKSVWVNNGDSFSFNASQRDGSMARVDFIEFYQATGKTK